MKTPRRYRLGCPFPALVLVLLGAASGCGTSSVPAEPETPAGQPASRIVFYAPPAYAPLLSEWADGLQPLVEVAAVADPLTAAQAGPADAIRTAVIADLDCNDCYRMERIGGAWAVHGSAPLGIQYGATHWLETLGFRFFHPWRTHRPAELRTPSAPKDLGKLFTPQRTLRGVQLHTLHPIEALFDFWVPGEASFEGARRTIDWLVKNRANYLQWVALDEHQRTGGGIQAWQAHTRRIVDYAHTRGLRVGLAIQLFGASNLQRAWDLLDTGAEIANAPTVIRTRLSAVIPDLGLDRLNLSFGEFFGADPDLMVSMIDLTRQTIDELAPEVEMTATIHVGNPEELTVEYRGETLMYYFLVKFADPRIIPWVHTVMYYELFGDAGGAYWLDDFSESADFLLERLAAGQRVGFYPESAYWVTFDNPVPTYLPLYMRTRWQDIADIDRHAAEGGFASFSDHQLFSSGWEWGYWQNDYATLRMSYELPAHWHDVVEDMFAPWGAAGTALAHAITALGDLQHEYLIGRRLGPYLAARDALLDIGEVAGIRSQPYRPGPHQVGILETAELQAFRTDVLGPLGELANRMSGILDALRSSGLPSDDPWVDEVVDGIEVTALRARFSHAVYSAAVAFGDGDAVQAWRDEAAATLAAARTVVTRRHSRLHDPDPQSLLTRGSNATVYPYGYLFYATQLCYWERELAQLGSLVDGRGSVPGCFTVTF